MKKRTAVILALAVLLVLPLWSCKESYSGEAGGEETSSSKEGKIQELEKQCVALTQNDDQGRVYNVILGKYQVNKDYMAVTELKDQRLRTVVLTFLVQGKEVILQTNPVATENEYNNLRKKIDSIIKDRTNNKLHQNRLYGVCAYTGRRDIIYIMNANTLKIIEG